MKIEKFLNVIAFLRRICEKRIRGQVAVFYALMIPIFLLAGGVGLDLGWYYLNVSRLQNAADASVIAGARTLAEDWAEGEDISTSSTTTTEVVNGIVNETITKTTQVATYKYNGMAAHYPANLPSTRDTTNGDEVAADYALKNLSTDTAYGKKENGNAYTMKDKYTRGDPTITLTPSLYQYGNDYYYVVHLKEDIHHFFLGFLNDMDAGVVAVAQISKEIGVKVDQEVHEALVDARNENVIVGNWEVQNKYRQSANLRNEYKKRFGHDFYTDAWNHFQDFFNTYKSGSFYRTETVTIKDDVDYTSDKPYGSESSVAATVASINNDENTKGYNPAYSNPDGTAVKKTYKEGVTETSSSTGLPFTWDKLDSINIDFKPEITFNTNTSNASYKYLSQDWDIGMDDTAVTFNHKKWTTTGNYSDADIKKLRIHSSINFDEPYKARKDEDGNDIENDILWTRIESEPMLYHPDVLEEGQTANVSVVGLSSVRQIIINANSSNYDQENQKYRPVIIFYDGPESNSIYASYDGYVRESQPVILNLNAPFRGVLYAPNSPVVVIGNSMNKFKGFVVAKKYMRLRTLDEYKSAGKRYYKKGSRSTELFLEDNGTYKDANGNVVSNSNVCSEDVYRLKNSNDTTNYYYVSASQNENGIAMMVDYYGNVQYADLDRYDAKVGEYDNFGRTNFTTHGYEVAHALMENLLISGN